MSKVLGNLVEKSQAMKCVSPLGCPLADGQCSKDGECFLWRCEHPHSPKPVSDEDLADLFKALVRAIGAARDVA